MSLPMHPMPREGTETGGGGEAVEFVVMHPMPREGTETANGETKYFVRAVMHPMPREGTETFLPFFLFHDFLNASYAP